MAKLYDVDGNEIIAFTEDELKTKQEEAVQEFLKKNPAQNEDVEKLKKELADAQVKIKEAEAGGNASEQQKARLKAAKEEAEGKLASTVENLTKEMNALRDAVVGSAKAKGMKEFSKGDKELQEKIELKYNSLMKSGDYQNNEEGIIKAISDATTLVTGTAPKVPGFLDNMSGAGSKGDSQKNNGVSIESDNSKDMRKVFGISDKDVEKYKGVDATKGFNN